MLAGSLVAVGGIVASLAGGILTSAVARVAITVGERLLAGSLGLSSTGTSSARSSSVARSFSSGSRLVAVSSIGTGSRLVAIGTGLSISVVGGSAVIVGTSGLVGVVTEGTIVAVVVVLAVVSSLLRSSVEARSLVCIALVVAIAVLVTVVSSLTEAGFLTVGISGESFASLT